MHNDDPISFLKGIDKIHIHGKNLLKKLNKSYDKALPFFEYYRQFYLEINDSEKQLSEYIQTLNTYKNKVYELNEIAKFSFQSKFESTILEEFLCVLLRNTFGNDTLYYGSVKAYSSLYFNYSNKNTFINNLEMKVNTKNQDVSIYKPVLISIDNIEDTLYVPIVCIECKTYLDKTMLEGSVATATKIKNGNPHCLFFIVTETYDISKDVSIENSQIDNIYILRKCKRNQNNQPEIQLDVIGHLLHEIENKLMSENISINNRINQRGYLR